LETEDVLDDVLGALAMVKLLFVFTDDRELCSEKENRGSGVSIYQKKPLAKRHLATIIPPL